MDIPTYVHVSPEGEEFYNEELNQTLQDGLSNNGWTVPQLTNAQIIAVAPQMPVGTIWYNTDDNKLQVLVGYNAGPPITGIIQTITSS